MPRYSRRSLSRDRSRSRSRNRYKSSNTRYNRNRRSLSPSRTPSPRRASHVSRQYSRKSRSYSPRRSRSPNRRRSRELRDHRVSSSSHAVEPEPRRETQPQAKALQQLKMGKAVSMQSSSIPLIIPQDIIKHYTFTGLSFHERFLFGEEERQIYPEENIAVGIERQIRGNSPAVIRRELRPSEVVLKRRKDEGEISFTSRSEFARYDGDMDSNDETRVVRVTKNDPVHRDYRKATIVYSESDRRDRGERETDLRNRDRPDRYSDKRVPIQSRIGSRIGTVRDKDTSRDDPRDLRNNLSKRSDEWGRLGERHSRSDNNNTKSERVSAKDRLGPIRQDRYNKQGKERLGPRQFKKKEEQEKLQEDELPDFSKRPDRFQQRDWQNQPEIIPRSSYYFEHDNRDDPDSFRGGRGRGFRGRGGSRGWVRNRSPSPELEWKHDKFLEFDKGASPESSS